MNRTRTPSAQTLVAGSLLAGTVALLVFVATASTSTTGCSSQETTPAPDASKPPCNEGPFPFCQVVAAGQPGCNTNDSTSPVLARLPRSTTYAVDCVVNLVGPRDEQGDCRLDGVCKCVIGDLPVTPAPVVEAGAPVDAGEDADAATEPQPIPDAGTVGPRTGPVWNCN